jgi:hypothetical protein
MAFAVTLALRPSASRNAIRFWPEATPFQELGKLPF